MILTRLFIVAAIFSLTSCAFVGSPMTASPTSDGTYWILQRDLVYQHPKTGEKIVVPKGFVTDLASVPRLFWTAFPPCGRYTPAAVVHDYLYWEQPRGKTREYADDVLLTAMEESKVSWTTRNAIYRAVRAGGFIAWNDNAKLKAKGEVRQLPANLLHSIKPDETWSDIKRRIGQSPGLDSERTSETILP
jgi:hypothetical protein